MHINFVSCEVIGGGQLGMGDLTNGGEGGLLLLVFWLGFMSGSSEVESKNNMGDANKAAYSTQG